MTYPRLLVMLVASGVSGALPNVVSHLAAVTTAQLVSDGTPSPTWCGRSCNCGTGERQTIETEEGRRIIGYVPPSGASCACAEVYRCEPHHIGAPASAPAPVACPGESLHIINTGFERRAELEAELDEILLRMHADIEASGR